MKHGKPTITYNELKAMGACDNELRWLREESMGSNSTIPTLCDKDTCSCRDNAINVNAIYKLVKEHKPEWVGWMESHFTDEALGIAKPKEEFCECHSFKVAENELGEWAGEWFKIPLKDSCRAIYCRFCWWCGKKLAPPKSEMTFKVGDKIIINGGTYIIGAYDKGYRIILINIRTGCRYGNSVNVSNWNDITEAELRKVVGDAKIEKVQ